MSGIKLWSPYIKGLWITRMPADHACRTITGADEIKFVKGEKSYPDPISSTTKHTWSGRDANSGPQRWEKSY